MSIDREKFLAHLRYWKDHLSLGNYTIGASYDYDGVGGECEMNHSSLLANISIGETDEIWTEETIARHEMLELLLEPLYSLCSDRVHPDLAYRAGHEVIHRLEEIIPIPSDKEVGYVGKKKKKAKKEKEMPCGKKKKPKGK